jgi:alkanesulfonate monooxygenase SsuD/methylene tetrahydromethanopterin reductase-like flavin-dependent oxidoreductase (luciferase family)
MDRFAEFVDLTDRLLREPKTSYEGQFYSAHEARSHPGCVQRPRIPFAIAATGSRGMRLAATYAETWVTNGDRISETPLDADSGVNVVREQMARLDDACASIGRDPGSIRRLVMAGVYLDAGLASVEAFRNTTGVYAAAGATDFVVHWPRPNDPYRADMGMFERILAAWRGDTSRGP